MKVERLPVMTATARAVLTTAMAGDDDELARQIRARVAELWCIDDDTYVITRVDAPEGGDAELTVCCIAGKNIGGVGAAIVKAARLSGCGTIFFHSRRPALVRLLNRLGFAFREYARVYSMGVPDGQ